LTAATLVEPPVQSGFDALGLSPPLLDALHRAKYYEPTPIQAALIPHAVAGRDVIGQAQTGTGKTAAFLLPFLNSWREDGPGPQALILAPTRELVVQVAGEAEKLSPSGQCRAAAIYGGQRIGTQLEKIRRGVDVVVGSPGRVLDHLARGTLKFDTVRYVVLDEADRMLDIGFRPDIERILKRCPKQRQTLLLSATVPDAVKRLAQRYMIDPLHVSITPDQPTVDKIKQSFYTVDDDKKFELLLRVLVKERPRQCIIFCERKRWADRLYRNLAKHLPRCAAMHGDLPQPQRDRIMKQFRDGRIVILVATDVVGRGIDVVGISHIINYDLPADIENYVHRIGRTGRIGKDGVAIAFVTPEQGQHLTEIESAVNRLLVEERIEGFQAYTPRVAKPDEPKPEAKPVFGRNRTRRFSKRL